MLSAIKERAQGWIAWAIVIVITIPFALWGVNSYFEAQSKIVVAEVNGEKIYGEEYQVALDRQRAAMQRLLGKRYDPSMMDRPSVRLGVVENLVRDRLLVRDAIDKGYRISDAQLSELILSQQQFQRNGKFVPELYDRAVRSAGYSDSNAFEEMLRQNNALAQVRNGFAESAFVTDTERTRIARLQTQEREIDYFVLAPQRYLDSIKVSEDQIKARYDANPDAYRTDERVKVEYLRLSLADVAKQFQPTEEELREAYEANRDRYVSEQRHAAHILLTVPAGADEKAEAKVRDQAEQLAQRARDGADFAKLAEQYSQDPGSAKQGGDLGYVVRGATDPAFEQVLFALEPGQISDPVRTSFGYHVIRLIDAKTERKDFDAVRDELAQEIARGRATDRFLEMAETFRNLVYEHPTSLAPAATELGLEVKDSDWFTRAGGPGVASNAQVVKAAFSDEVLNEGLNSETIELDLDTLVAVRKLDHEPSAVRPLEDVRASIEAALKADAARERAAEEARSMRGELENGVGLEQLAARHEVKLRNPGRLMRTAGGEVDPRIVSAVFRAPRPQGGPVYGVVDLGPQGSALYALNAVHDSEPDALKQEALDRAASIARTHMGEDQFLSYERGLRQSAEVEINKEELGAVGTEEGR